MKVCLILFACVVALLPDHAEARVRRHVDANGNDTQIIGGRPKGCPDRYCGCALARFLGLADETLNLAANWLRFKHVPPAPGAVAAKRGHVMQLVRHVEGTKWVVRSYNDTRHMSLIRVRDIRRYTTVAAPTPGRA